MNVSMADERHRSLCSSLIDYDSPARRAYLANFVCCHLRIVGSVDDDAEKRLLVLGFKRRDALS
jgi:hypothetical protein